MARIKEITYEVSATVNVAEYEYCKPRISVTMELMAGDDEEAIFQELTSVVRKELKNEIKILKKKMGN